MRHSREIKCKMGECSRYSSHKTGDVALKKGKVRIGEIDEFQRWHVERGDAPEGLSIH